MTQGICFDKNMLFIGVLGDLMGKLLVSYYNRLRNFWTGVGKVIALMPSFNQYENIVLTNSFIWVIILSISAVVCKILTLLCDKACRG